MTVTLFDLVSLIVLWEGLAFLLLGAVLISHRFFGQPIDRIRLTQFGFGLVVIAMLWIAPGVGPKWSIALLPREQASIPLQEIIEYTAQPETIVADATEIPTQIENSDVPHQYNRPASFQETYTLPVVTPPTKVALPSPAIPTDDAVIPVVREQDQPVVAEPTSVIVLSTESPIADGFALSWNIIAWFGIAIFILPPLVLFVREVLAWICLAGISRRSSRAPEQVGRLFAGICGASQRTIDLRVSWEITVPVVFGVFRTTMLIPRHIVDSQETPSNELRACLAHEWSHLVNHDLTTWNIVRLFQYPLWMQPFYWMLRARLLADQDYLADDVAARECPEPADYAQLLFDLAQNRPSPLPGNALGMAGRKSQLRRRMEMLMNDSRPTRISNKRRLLLPCLLLIALTLLGGSIRLCETTTANDQSEPAALARDKSIMQPLTITRNADDEWEISGVLYDKDSKPAQNVAVLLYEEPNSGPTEIVKEAPPVRTGDNGKFTLKSKKMFAILGRSADGCDFFYDQLPPDSEREDHAPIAQLLPGDAITGTVVDKVGSPIAGATVGYYTKHRLNHQVESDMDGRFVVYRPKNSPEVHALFAYKSQAGLDYRVFASDMEQNELEEDQKTDLTQPFRLTLTGAKPVRLTLQWDDGTPAAGITMAPWTLWNPNQRTTVVHPPGFASPSLNFASLQYSTRQVTDDDGIVEFDWMPEWLEHVDFFYADFPWWAENIPWLRLNLSFRTDPHDKIVTLHRKRKVSGTVRFPDGQPAEGITVKYDGVSLEYEYKRQNTQTNAAGYYEMDIDPEAAYILAVENADWAAPAYNPFVVNVHTKPEELQNLDFTLQKPTRVYGKMTFGPERKIIPGYRIAFSNKGKSDESLPEDKQLTRPRPEGDQMVPPGGSPPPRRDLNYSLWRETWTNDDGDYSIALGPGEYTITIHENYVGMQGFVRNLVPDDTTVIIPDNTTDATGEMVYDIAAEASKNGRIEGKVTLADGTPADGAKLLGAYFREDYVFQDSTPDFTATTDAEGQYDVPRTLQVMQLFVKSADGREAALVAVDDQRQELNVTLRPVGFAQGTAVDHKTGLPLANIELQYGIQVYGLDDKTNYGDHDEQMGYPKRFLGPLRFGGTFTTDADGHFQLENPVAGPEYKIVFRPKKEFRRHDTDTFLVAAFQSEPSQTFSLGKIRINTMLLEGAAPLTVPKFIVTALDDESGKPIPGMQVSISWGRNESGKLSVGSWGRHWKTIFVSGNKNTDESGQYQFDWPSMLVPDGVEMVVQCGRFDSPAYVPDWVTLTEPFDATQNITMRLKRYQSVSGKVFDADGQPLAGVTLKFRTNHEPSEEVIDALTHDENVRSRTLLPNEFKSMETVTAADGTFGALLLPGFTTGQVVIHPPGAAAVEIDLKDRSPDRPEDWIFTLNTQ